MSDEIHKGDIGTLFTFTITNNGATIDLSSASTKQIIFSPPGGVKLTKAAEFVTNGSDGKLKYAAISGDLSVEGLWSAQAHVALPTGEWSSSVVEFMVHPNL